MILQGVTIVDSTQSRQCDLYIEEGIVKKIAPPHSFTHEDSHQCIACEGFFLIPALIETNVYPQDRQLKSRHLNDLCVDAREGGVSRIVTLPFTEPEISDTITFEFVLQHNNQAHDVELKSVMSAVSSEQLNNIAILLKKGVVAPFVSTTIDNNLMCRVAEYAKMYEVPLWCKAEDASMRQSGVMAEGDTARELGLAGISTLNEELHVARVIEIAAHYDIEVLFKAIASPRSIELIAKAKQEGVRVSCEVSVHHLRHSDRAALGFDTRAKIDPPLAVESDRLALIEALKNGDIAMLTSLHHACSAVNKEVAFFDAMYGTTALRDTFSLYYETCVVEHGMSMKDFVAITSDNAMHIQKREPIVIKEGEKIEALLIDPNGKHRVEDEQSLYYNKTLQGAIVERLF